MTLEECFKAGYELFGPEAMKIMDQFFSGEIDWETCIDRATDSVINYRIHRMMWDEIEKTHPKMIKITSKFADYLNTKCVKFTDISDDLPEDAMIGQFEGIPIEIDDTYWDYYEYIMEAEGGKDHKLFVKENDNAKSI